MKCPFKTPVVIQESSNEGVGLLMKEVPGQVICEFEATPEMREHAEFVAFAVNQEMKLQSKLKPTTYNPLPFVVETSQRDGSCPRYRVSRHRGGGVYSDEFLKKEEADFVRHTLEREEANNEQLRYRIWQLEQALKSANDALVVARQNIIHHPMCAAESEINKACNCRRAAIDNAIKKIEGLQ